MLLNLPSTASLWVYDLCVFICVRVRVCVCVCVYVCTAIKQLESLSIVTTSGSDGEAPGFGDAHVIDGFALLKSLKYLRLHGDSTSLTNEVSCHTYESLCV